MLHSGEILQNTSEETRDLEAWLLEAVKENATDDLAAIKELYQKEYPNQMESIETLFGFAETLDLRKELAELHDLKDEGQKVDHKRIMEIVHELAGYNFLFTHSILESRNDRQFLEKFWKLFDAIAVHKNASLDALKVKRGIVTQAATMHAFRQLGFKAELSKPSDDLKKIDMWISGRHKRAVQIKRAKVDQVEIIETDQITVPATKVDMHGTPWHISSDLFYEAQRFKVSVDRYRKETNKPSLRGYFIVIPYDMVDVVTGEPSEALIAEIKDRLAGNPSASKVAA